MTVMSAYRSKMGTSSTPVSSFMDEPYLDRHPLSLAGSPGWPYYSSGFAASRFLIGNGSLKRDTSLSGSSSEVLSPWAR